MPENEQPAPERAKRQIRRKLESLKAAGVEWVPQSNEPPVLPPPPEVPAAQPEVAAAAPLTATASLFTEAEAQPDPSLTPDARRHELTVLAERVANCTRCPELVSTRTQTVFGTGPIDVELCFVGEAPGADEDRTGQPFVGAAGQLLNRIIAACGMKREEVFICNILRCRPPGNRVPKPDECANCREYLERTLELVRPKFICALGLTAAQSLLGTRSSLGKLRSRFHDYKGIPVICTYHPAALLPSRSPEKKRDVWEDMKMLLTRMGKPIPMGKAGEK